MHISHCWLYFVQLKKMYLLSVLSGQEQRGRTAPVAADVPTQPETLGQQTGSADAWADSVLGWLEDHPPCPHCLMGPCVTVSEVTRLQGSCAPDITNHSKRHKDYRRFWKSLKDRGLWQHELYIDRKTSAGLSEVELHELMPQCVLDDTRKRYPNPPGVPYMGHKRA